MWSTFIASEEEKKLLQGIIYFVSVVLGFFSTLIIIRIIVSWILFFIGKRNWNPAGGSNGNNQNNTGIISSLDSLLGKICDPYLNHFRGVSFLRRSGLDLTPLLALAVLHLVKSLLESFVGMETFSAGYILAILVSVVWRDLCSFLLFLLIVLLVIRFFLGRSSSPGVNNWINSIDPILDPPVSFVYKLFFRGKKVDEQKVVIAAIFFYLFVLLGLGSVVGFLVNLLKSV